MSRFAALQLLRRSAAAGEMAVTGARGLATEAQASVRLPPQHSIAGRYASALYMAAVKGGKLDAVEKEVSEVAGILAQSKDLSGFIEDPSVPRATKAEGLKAILGKMGASDITRNFVSLLSDNNRLAHLERIVESFVDIAAQQKGVIKASVTTAEPLTPPEIQQLHTGLKQLLKPGQSLKLEERVDPAIIAGIVIDIGDKHVDMSALSRVRKLQQIIREAV